MDEPRASRSGSARPPRTIDDLAQLRLHVHERELALRASAPLDDPAGDPPTARELRLAQSLDELRMSVEALGVAEEELRQQSEELITTRDRIDVERLRYQEMFQFAPDAYVVTSRDGIVREVNQAACRLFGTTARFALGKPIVMFFADDERAAVRTQLARLGSGARDRIDDWEARLRSNEGRVLHGDVTVAAVHDGDTVTSLRWSVRDATARLRAQGELAALTVELEQRVAERTRQLAAASSAKDELYERERAAHAEAERARDRLTFLAFAGAVLADTLNRDDVLATLTRRVVPFLGDWCGVVTTAERADGAGRLVSAHDDPALDALDADLHARLARGELPFGVVRAMRDGAGVSIARVEAALIDATAEEGPALRRLREHGVHTVAVAPLVARGRTLGAVITFCRREGAADTATEDAQLLADVARRGALALDNALLLREAAAARADAERASESKSAFLAMMSHELRTPLASIAGYAELLAMGAYGPLPDSQLEILARIGRSHEHLTGLVDNVLSYSRIKHGEAELDLADVDLGEFLAQLGAHIEPAQRIKRLRYACEGPADRTVLRTDRGKLRQIVLNLLSNAVKFTPEAGEIVLAWERCDGEVCVRVRDTGRGIPADKLEAIFEPYVQVERGRTGEVSGTGLGLAISRTFACALGGSLTVESCPGRGSTFTLRLPLSPPVPPAVAASAIRMPDRGPATG